MAPKAEHAESPATRVKEFPTTQWSLIQRAGAAETTLARNSLEALCRRYWYPLYAFLRRQGYTHTDAEDVTQGFFAHVLASDSLSYAVPERGRFRTFLLSSLRHYAASTWRRSQTAKRGGDTALLPLELINAETFFAAEPADIGLTPEDAFDRNWALGLITQAVGELCDEYAASGRAAQFSALLPHVFGETTESQATAAGHLGLNEHAFTVAVSRLRKRLRERLRAHVADTVTEEGETDDELRILLRAFRQRTNPV